MNKSIKSGIKNFINLPLGVFGVELKRKYERLDRAHSMPSCMERLQHVKKLGFFPKVIFDGGAFKGLWSSAIAEVFPGSQIVLMEPNPNLQDTIKSNISGIHPPAILLNVALGEMPGEKALNIWGDVNSAPGASLFEHVQGKADTIIQVEVDTLDNISKRLALTPDLLKLDLQGGELLALNGGSKILKDTEFAIIEFGCLEAYMGRATPRDIIDVMYDNDYGLYDIVNCHYRPYDRAMAGGDFFFVKNWSILRNYKGWK